MIEIELYRNTIINNIGRPLYILYTYIFYLAINSPTKYVSINIMLMYSITIYHESYLQ